jgi:glycosyltransferase involved in cell wall biosynthesis
MIPRVAFFTDSFYEVNGVAHTSRQFDAFARRRELPFLNVHAPAAAIPEPSLNDSGPVWQLDLPRGHASFALENDLAFDLLLWRHRHLVTSVLRRFQPDLVHVTGPGDFGMLAAYVAHRLKIPLVASWHTNVHEYAGRRLERLLASFFPERPLHRLGAAAEKRALWGTALFYKIARLLFAPNDELVAMLRRETGKPCFLMQRGVDADLFNPARRDPGERPLTLGYVGRLSTEKNVRFLVDVESALRAKGISDYRFLIAGAGADREWLEQHLDRAEFAGVVKGEELARTYANMDVFLFPSQTDTFGNVILESLASGVPVVVTTGGGPKYLVRHGVTGLIAGDDQSFLAGTLQLATDHELRRRMSTAARAHACSISWDRVFEKVYEAYECLTYSAKSSSIGSPPSLREEAAGST